MGILDWESNTNTTENSCKSAQCDCSTFWEVQQQEAMMRVSNLQDKRKKLYKKILQIEFTILHYDT